MHNIKKQNNNLSVCCVLQLALLSHNCVPNTSHSVGSDYKCRVRTTVAVKKGDELFSTYTHTLLPTYARREHLKLSKYFDCQ